MIVAAAAAEWGVPAGEIATAAGTARHASSRAIRNATGRWRRAPRRCRRPTQPALKDAARIGSIGTRASGVDNHAIVTGQRLFGLDVKLPGMKYAAVAKSPVFGQRPVKVDNRAALAVPGVRQTVEIAGLDNPTQLMPGVAVVADSTLCRVQGPRRARRRVGRR